METVGTTPPADAELHLLTEWTEAGAVERRRKAAVATVALHILVISGLAVMPSSMLETPEPRVAPRIITPLVQPSLTQKAPNTGKVTAEFEVRAEAPRPKLQMPERPPTPKQAPRPAVIPQAPAPRPAAPVSMPEAPKLEVDARPQIKNDLPAMAQAAPPPPPQIQPVEQPKLALENVTGPRQGAPSTVPRIPVPSSSVSSAIHDTVHGVGSGGQAVGDPGVADPGLFGGIRTPPSPGVQGASLELKSDPGGVDFKPYLQQILAAIRRNWMAVIPESVKMGLRGRVALQFRISKDGRVVRLVYAEQSGSRPLDEAAVAGVSASNPLPPLPGEFKGDSIVVQFNFAYNMPRR